MSIKKHEKRKGEIYILKNKIIKVLAMVLLSGGILFGGSQVYNGYTVLEEEKTALTKELNTVKATNGELKDILDETESTLNKTKESLEKTSKEKKDGENKVKELNKKIASLEEELSFKRAAREEAERLAAEEQAKASQTKVAQTASAPAQASYTSSGGGLTASAGVYNGPSGKETYYSQKVLPGGGLSIPGRHVAGDGTVRDADGFIVIASDNLPKGATAETSLGTGKVYDTGVGHPGVDIYTNW